jgi:hypothetical protein
MKIINCSIPTFNRTEQYKKLENIDVYNKSMENNFSKLSLLVDRTKSIPHFLDIDYSYSPIPINPSFNLDFNSVVKNRCIELLSTNKQINVAWSGGLDSTFVLLSLYHYANDPDQIKVYGTYNSIIESGDFFDKFIKDKIRYSIRVNSSPVNNFYEDGIYVTGAMSNQLFTPGVSYNKNRDCLLQFKDIEFIGEQDKPNDILIELGNRPYADVLTDECLEFLNPCILNSPKKLNTLQDLRWYLLFNFTWYSVLTQAIISLDKNKSDKIIPFFATDEFQLWALYNNDPTTKVGDYSDERWQIREMIAKYTGDTYFSLNKKKFTSVLSPTPNNWLYLLNDHTNVYV